MTLKYVLRRENERIREEMENLKQKKEVEGKSKKHKKDKESKKDAKKWLDHELKHSLGLEKLNKEMEILYKILGC